MKGDIFWGSDWTPDLDRCNLEHIVARYIDLPCLLAGKECINEYKIDIACAARNKECPVVPELVPATHRFIVTQCVEWFQIKW